jgi:hypothetical protein
MVDMSWLIPLAIELRLLDAVFKDGGDVLLWEWNLLVHHHQTCLRANKNHEVFVF